MPMTKRKSRCYGEASIEGVLGVVFIASILLFSMAGLDSCLGYTLYGYPCEAKCEALGGRKSRPYRKECWCLDGNVLRRPSAFVTTLKKSEQGDKSAQSGQDGMEQKEP